MALPTNTGAFIHNGVNCTPNTIQTAQGVPYDNTSSGLSATNVQRAIDEVNTTATTHIHGDITHDGKLTNAVLTVANGDKLVVTDNDNDSKLQRTSIYFDASTTNKALSQKGTWEAIDRVNQTTVSDNADRPILLGATGTSDVNSNVGKVSTLTYNPSTGNLKATKLNNVAVSDITDHQQLYSYRLTNVGSKITIRMSVPVSVEFLIHIVGAVSNGGAFYDSILTGTSVSSGTATIYVRNNGSANLGSVIITNTRIKFTVTGYTQLLITSLHKITNIEATVS